MNPIANKTLILLALTALSTVNAGDAFARVGQTSDDMFYDQGYIYDRPSVPSDRLSGEDVFPAVQNFWNAKAEMFDHANKINIMGSEDMLRTRHIAQVPIHLLKIDR